MIAVVVFIVSISFGLIPGRNYVDSGLLPVTSNIHKFPDVSQMLRTFPTNPYCYYYCYYNFLSFLFPFLAKCLPDT